MQFNQWPGTRHRAFVGTWGRDLKDWWVTSLADASLTGISTPWKITWPFSGIPASSTKVDSGVVRTSPSLTFLLPLLHASAPPFDLKNKMQTWTTAFKHLAAGCSLLRALVPSPFSSLNTSRLLPAQGICLCCHLPENVSRRTTFCSNVTSLEGPSLNISFQTVPSFFITSPILALKCDISKVCTYVAINLPVRLLPPLLDLKFPGYVGLLERCVKDYPKGEA